MKKELKTEMTKERIMEAAMAEFGSKGYFGASLNQICSAGIPKGLLYHNYKNKDALYLACVRQSLDRLTFYLKNLEAEPQLYTYMNARLCFFQHHEYEARLFFEALLQPPVHLQKQIKELRSELDELNRYLYERILDSLLLRSGITKETAMEYFILLQNMFNGYFSSPALSGLSLTETIQVHEQQILTLLDYMIYGIAERRTSK